MTTTFQSNTVNLADIIVKDAVQRNWQWLLGLGIALVTLGTISILMATVTTLISVISFGVFLLINSGLLIYQTFKIWWHQWGNFFLQLSIGLLYALAGITFITYPVSGAISLTLMLALFYIILGSYRGALAVMHRTPGWGWMLFSSLITVILGVTILLLWPAASFWVIGMFIGIDIIFVGWAFIMSALAARGDVVNA